MGLSFETSRRLAAVAISAAGPLCGAASMVLACAVVVLVPNSNWVMIRTDGSRVALAGTTLAFALGQLLLLTPISRDGRHILRGAVGAVRRTSRGGVANDASDP